MLIRTAAVSAQRYSGGNLGLLLQGEVWCGGRGGSLDLLKTLESSPQALTGWSLMPQLLPFQAWVPA